MNTHPLGCHRQRKSALLADSRVAVSGVAAAAQRGAAVDENPPHVIYGKRSDVDTLPGGCRCSNVTVADRRSGPNRSTVPTVIGRMLGQCCLVGRDTSRADYSVGVDLMTLIDVRAGVRGGKPCFVATRITVYDLLEYLASGMTAAEIVADSPGACNGSCARGARVRCVA